MTDHNTGIVYQRNWGEGLAPARFSLGKFGNFVNGVSLVFLVVSLIFQFFPYAPHPDAKDMNWSIVIYMVAVLFFTFYYFLRARNRYVGPVMYVKRHARSQFSTEKGELCE